MKDPTASIAGVATLMARVPDKLGDAVAMVAGDEAGFASCAAGDEAGVASRRATC